MDLERFVRAQDSGGTYQRALTELRNGRKTSHWMWFIFPQIAGLGRSAMAQAYAISDLAEAQGYLAHPVLGHGWSSAPRSSPRTADSPQSTSSAALTRSSCAPR